jgi:peptide/nickel transport system substrate-binding protein
MRTGEHSRRFAGRRASRRAALRAGALGTAGLVGALALACGDEERQETGSGTGAVAASTAGGAPAGEVKRGGTLKGSTQYDVDTLDAIRTKSFRTYAIAAFTYSRLLRFKTAVGQPADGSVEGDASDRWEQPDPTTLIMHLRDGMKLDQRPPTGGRVLTSEDVVLSWDAFAADSVYRADLANAANKDAPVVSLRATDPNTIEVKTAFPDATLLPSLAFGFDLWIMPKEAFNGGFDPATAMRGSGPWTLERYTSSVSWSFKKNPTYYGAPEYPVADAVELAIITDTAQAEAQFKAKNIWFGVGSEPVAIPDILSIHNGLKQDTEVVLGGPSVAGPSISFGWRENSPYRDKRVRQALSMMLDRDTYIDLFSEVKSFQAAGVNMKGYWSAPYGAGFGPFWLDPKDPAFGPSAQYLQFNVAEVKKLLTAAGYPNGFETPFTFNPTTEYGRDWAQRAEALIAMLNAGGIRAKANPVDYSTVWLPAVFRKQGDWDGVAMYPNGARPDPGQWLSVFFASTGASTQLAKNFPELDALILKQRQELDRTRRIPLFHDIQRYCTENMVVAPQGGGADVPVLSLKGLRGPGLYNRWGGNTSSDGIELLQYFWIDDPLRR